MQYVDEHVTLPQALALFSYWRIQPTLVTLVSRVCRYFDIEVGSKTPPLSSKPSTPEDALAQFRSAGVPIFEGKPDDPMLDLL